MNLAKKTIYFYLSIAMVAIIAIGVIFKVVANKAAQKAEKQQCIQLLSVDSLKANNVTTKLKYRPLNTPVAWNSYFNITKNDDEPYETLVTALKAYQKNNKQPGLAVDLGAGTGRDSLYLLKNGWHVVAIDFAKKGLGILNKRVSEKYANNLQIQVADIANAHLPNNIDLANASYTLPYIPPEKFLKAWENITQHIRPGGIFAGHFFGLKDDSAKDPDITIVTRAQLNCLFRDFNVIYINEDLETAPTAAGKTKHWDVWEVVAVKN